MPIADHTDPPPPLLHLPNTLKRKAKEIHHNSFAASTNFINDDEDDDDDDNDDDDDDNYNHSNSDSDDDDDDDDDDVSLGDADDSPVKRLKLDAASGKVASARAMSVASPNDKHDEKRPYVCTYPGCANTYKKPCKLAEHERVHTGERPFVCPHPGCNKAYRRSTHLVVHAKTHDPATGKPFACPEEGCAARFATRQHLVRHSTLHQQPKPYMCTHPDCSQTFAKNHQLRNHMTTHTGKKPFVCEHEGCTQSFMISAKLRKHQRVHSVEPRYRCGYTGCTSDFTRWSQLQQHIRDAHPTKCPRCGKALKTRDGLSKHLKTHIDGRQTFPCYFPECEKIFASVKSLNVHIRSRHEGLRPFKCEFEECNSAFAHKHLLVRHRRIHEEPKTPKAKKTTPDLPKATALTEIEVLTGTNYAGAGTRRHIRCAFEDCPFVFARRQDLERHLKSFVHDEDIEELVGAEPQLEEVGNETQLGGKLTGGEWAKGATVVSVGGGQRMALKRRIQSTEKVLAELDAQFGDAEGRKGLLLALGINDK